MGVSYCCLIFMGRELIFIFTSVSLVRNCMVHLKHNVLTIIVILLHFTLCIQCLKFISIILWWIHFILLWYSKNTHIAFPIFYSIFLYIKNINFFKALLFLIISTFRWIKNFNELYIWYFSRLWMLCWAPKIHVWIFMLCHVLYQGYICSNSQISKQQENRSFQ